MPDDEKIVTVPKLSLNESLRERLGLPPEIEPLPEEALIHGEQVIRQILDNMPGISVTSVSGHGVIASTGGPGAGVFARSDKGMGIRAESMNSHGVVARSRSAAALWADTSGDAPGVIGTSAHAQGIWGESYAANRCGVAGVGNNGHGLVGETRSPHHAGITARGPEWAGRFEGKVHVLRDLLVDGDIVLSGADLAEQFTVVGSAEPGDVMILSGADTVRMSRDPYDTRVAGVISGAGDYRPALVLDHTGKDRSSLAMTGKVWVRVTAELSEIRVGDLLTTSPDAGHAMRALDPARSHGAVLGKALDSLASGRGLIRALVSLH